MEQNNNEVCSTKGAIEHSLAIVPTTYNISHSDGVVMVGDIRSIL